MMYTKRMPVHKHFGIHVHALEIKAVELLHVFCSNVQIATVPALSGRAVSTVISRRLIHSRHTLDAPVMRKIDHTPLRIIIRGFCKGFLPLAFALEKSPSGIHQGLSFTSRAVSTIQEQGTYQRHKE